MGMLGGAVPITVSQNTLPTRKNDLRKQISFRPRPANVLATCTKYCACRADENRRTSCTCHASDILDLRPGNLMSATKNAHSSKNGNGVPAKVDLRKRATRYTHFVLACAVEMHIAISLRNLCASRHRQNPREP